MPAFSKNKSEVLFDLSRFLISRGIRNQTSVLIVDEAHSLTNEMLEEIRLLTNLETSEEKLLQVVLVGQPELDEKLDSVCLRQLKQRIALRVSLRMLGETETKGYIQQRLRVAGLAPSSTAPFSVQAIEAIYRLSSGTPRLINTICENSLIAGYAKRMRVVGPDLVERVAQDLGIGKRFSCIRGGDRYGGRVTDAPYSSGIDGKDPSIVEGIPVS
jgi:type II secretory pathway predicted ATPase ExeA